MNECTDGDYTYKRGFLVWNISVISPDANSVTIDFDLPASSGASNDDFFPIGCSFNSEYNLAGLIVSFCTFFVHLLIVCKLTFSHYPLLDQRSIR